MGSSGRAAIKAVFGDKLSLCFSEGERNADNKIKILF